MLYQPDGLPNHTHYLQPDRYYIGRVQGGYDNNTSWAINTNNSYQKGSPKPTVGGKVDDINNIYGSSNFVQPKSVSLIPILKY